MKSVKGEMSFLGHLEALRWHLVRSAIAILLFAMVAFIFQGYIIDIVMAPKSPGFITNAFFCQLSSRISFINVCINQNDFPLTNLQMSGQFMMALKISITTGLVLGCPYFLYEMWNFLKPALMEGERKHTTGIISSSSLLFISGVLFGYYILAPISINFFASYTIGSGVTNSLTLQSYIDLLISIILACGAAFELPLVIYFLSKFGIVTSSTLKKYRKHAVVGVLVLAAIITPPDVFSQVLISIPLLVLYESGIILAKRIEKKNSLSSVDY